MPGTTHWVQKDDMPVSGIECPDCGQGFLQRSRYGIWCPICKANWKISKFPPSDVAPKFKKAIPVVNEPTKDKNIQALRNIWLKLDEILEVLKQRIDG